MRETGSQIVIDTIENALHQGGLALFGEGFQIDSSVGYDFGDNEGVRGDLDVVVPLLNWRGHVVFVQPGAIFWTGIEKEERIDGNVGLVYRKEIIRDLIAGASVFYDHDFQIGHSRVSGGIDLQSGSLLLGANYYHVLSEIEDGREGFVEEAVDGMDLRLALEKEIVRAEATVGYWDYEGKESSGGESGQSGWQTFMGIDFGFRVIPGVFVEARWEKHKDDLVLDERIFAGLAFRFSLPDLEGASYGNGEATTNLYKLVDREKRILYEEREADGILLSYSGSVVEGGTVNVAIQLREPSAEDVTLNLIGSGSAEYGSSNDYTVSVGGTDCTGVTGASCQVTITAGETNANDNVVITINDDGGGESEETIILSTTVDSGDASLTSRPLALRIPADLPPPPLPTVSLITDSTSIREGGTATLTLTLSESLGSDATFNLITGGNATYGTDADWNLSVGGNDCGMASESDPCQVMISQNDTTAEVTVEVNTDSTNETSSENFTVSVVVDSGSTNIVQEGSQSSLNFTIPADLPTVSFNYTGRITNIGSVGNVRMTIELSEAISEPVTLYIVGTGSTAAYGIGAGWDMAREVVEPDGRPSINSLLPSATCPGVTGTNCPVTIQPGSTIIDVEINATGGNNGETIVISVDIPLESAHLVKLGDPMSVTLTF